MTPAVHQACTFTTLEPAATDEGELAGFAQGSLGDKHMALGFVFLDDSFVRVVGETTEQPEPLKAAVRHLVLTMKFFLGNPRRRPFKYTSPAGWRRMQLASGDDTWLAPTYPLYRASITVPRALPTEARSQLSVVTTLLGLTEVPAPQPESIPIFTRPELTGNRWERRITMEGLELVIVVVSLTDRRYDYFVRMIAPVGSDAASRVFEQLLASIQPIPMPAAQRELDGVAFWCA